jgi:hypothetical protein
MLWILKYFRRKIWRKHWRFLLKLVLIFVQSDRKIGFWEKRQSFSPKIAIITSTPGHGCRPCLSPTVELHIWHFITFFKNRRLPTRVKGNPGIFWFSFIFRHLKAEPHRLPMCHTFWENCFGYTFMSGRNSTKFSTPVPCIQNCNQGDQIGRISAFWKIVYFGKCWKITKLALLLFSNFASELTKNGQGDISGDFFTNSSGHPALRTATTCRSQLPVFNRCSQTMDSTEDSKSTRPLDLR